MLVLAFPGAEQATGGKMSTEKKGASYENAIVIDDDETGDDDGDSKNRPKASRRQDLEMEETLPSLKKAKRSLKTEGLHAPPKMLQSTGKHATKQWMLNPSLSPIKIFATKQDEDLRTKWTEDHWSYSHCWTLREILGMDSDVNEGIDWMVISNFVIDFDFLLEELPELLSIPTVLVVYGSKESSEARWKYYATQPDGSCAVDFLNLDPSAPKRSSSNPLKVQMPWGCHHTKLFLIGYSSGRLRVVVHTANLRWNDVHMKTQGAFIQDFLPKTRTSSQTSDFEESLVSYLETYHFNKARIWKKGTSERHSLITQMRQYDFSTAIGVLIPSSPGYHKAVPSKAVGYLKVRQAIRKYLSAPLKPSSPFKQQKQNPLVFQFSSIGSLSKRYLNDLWSAWDVASVHRCGPVTKGADDGANLVRLVYPTVEEIIRSVEGIAGGGSVPGRQKNVNKEFLQSLYCKWASSENEEDTLQKGQNVPHIKTYYQLDDDTESMKWFVLTSHNLSKGK